MEPTTLALFWAGVLAISILVYVVLDGFDLGVGILFGTTKDETRRKQMLAAIGPFWDGNETWLVVIGATLFAAFPAVYAVFLGAFYLPVLVMLVGLIFRGVAFEFRSRSGRMRPFWDWGFVIGSVAVAFVQGAAVGALMRGVAVENGQFAGTALDWLHPFPILTGLGLVIGYTLLGAGWLKLKTQGDLRDWAAEKIRHLAVALVVVLGAAFLVAMSIDISAGLRQAAARFDLLSLLFVVLAAGALYGVFTTARSLSDGMPFGLTVLAFVAAFATLATLMWPYMIPYALTIGDAAAPDASLGFVFYAGAIALPIIAAYTIGVYWVFRGKVEAAARHKVVVVGGGFGGLTLVRALRGLGVDITLVDQRNHHIFQPLLYQVATSILPPSDIAWPIRSLFRDRKDVTTLLGEVDRVDAAAKQVHLSQGETLEYDTLVLATGARHSYFGHDEWQSVAPGLKSLEDAVAIRRGILNAFEAAERVSDPAEREALLTFAIIGGGPTGVELAGIIAELAQEVLPREFRNIDTRSAKVLLIEAGPRLLAMFPEALSDYSKSALESRGVTVLLGQPVTAITETSLTLGGVQIPTRCVFWAAGVAASPAARWLQAEADRAGRVIVAPDLSVPGHSDIFAIGDTAHVAMDDGRPVPGVAPAAKQQGVYVAQVLQARLAGLAAPKSFQYVDMGNLATIGKRAAVVEMGPMRLKGALAWWVWGFAHIYFLIGARSRIGVALTWLWSLVTGQKSDRLISKTGDPHAPVPPSAQALEQVPGQAPTPPAAQA